MASEEKTERERRKRTRKLDLSSDEPEGPYHTSAPLHAFREQSLTGSKYRPEYGEKLIEHISNDGDLCSFAVEIGVCKWTLMNWARSYPKFRQAYRVARTMLEVRYMKLGRKGMKGELSQGAWGSAWIFLMKAKHGWRDDGTVSEDDDGDDEADVQFDFTRSKPKG